MEGLKPEEDAGIDRIPPGDGKPRYGDAGIAFSGGQMKKLACRARAESSRVLSRQRTSAENGQGKK